MTRYLIFLIIILLFSCNENDKDKIDLVLFPDSTNYEYFRVSDSITKVVRYYPGTKDSTIVYFYDREKRIKDSTSYFYYKTGELEATIRHKDKMRIKYVTNFYRNGNKERQFKAINDMPIGKQKYYYQSGKLKDVYEWRMVNGKTYLNKLQRYKENGELDSLKTYYANIKVDSDTVNFNESIKVDVDFLVYSTARILIGKYNNKFKPEGDESYIFKLPYIYTPKKHGNDTIRLIVEYKVNNKDESGRVFRTLLSKPIFVKN